MRLGSSTSINYNYPECTGAIRLVAAGTPLIDNQLINQLIVSRALAERGVINQNNRDGGIEIMRVSAGPAGRIPFGQRIGCTVPVMGFVGGDGSSDAKTISLKLQLVKPLQECNKLRLISSRKRN